jgi:hypothetical protein
MAFSPEIANRGREVQRAGSPAARRAVLCNRFLYVAERSMVLNLAGRTAEKTGFKLHNHEHFFWHFVFTA